MLDGFANVGAQLDGSARVIMRYVVKTLAADMPDDDAIRTGMQYVRGWIDGLLVEGPSNPDSGVGDTVGRSDTPLALHSVDDPLAIQVTRDPSGRDILAAPPFPVIDEDVIEPDLEG